jgi:hypothetical protein
MPANVSRLYFIRTPWLVIQKWAQSDHKVTTKSQSDPKVSFPFPLVTLGLKAAAEGTATLDG